jgi:hypothetical protein
MADIGELVVGAWLTEVKQYDFVVYNQRPGRDLPENLVPPGPEGVSARLSELDVIGFRTAERQSYLAECTTHLEGLRLGATPDAAIAKLRRKLQVSAAYAQVIKKRTALEPQIALWSPRVNPQILKRREELEDAAGGRLDLVVNERYTERVVDLIRAATERSTGTGNDFYRTLQLLTHLKKSPLVALPPPTKQRIAEVAAEFTTVGQPVLNWQQVQAVHKTQHGIHAPRGGNTTSIICNTGPHAPYPDRFVGPDALRYVGWGPTGDQAMERDNESLRQAIERGVPIRVFEAVGKNKYLDHAEWYGDGAPEWHIEPSTGRRLVVFVLRRAQD